MSVLFMLPFMLTLGGAFLGLLVWAVRTLQYEDLEGDPQRIFFEDDELKAAAAEAARR